MKPLKQGVYNLRWGLRDIRIVVSSQIEQEERNAVWLMFSAVEESVRCGFSRYRGKLDEMSLTINDLLAKYQKEGIQGSRKTAAGEKDHPDRNARFCHINKKTKQAGRFASADSFPLFPLFSGKKDFSKEMGSVTRKDFPSAWESADLNSACKGSDMAPLMIGFTFFRINRAFWANALPGCAKRIIPPKQVPFFTSSCTKSPPFFMRYRFAVGLIQYRQFFRSSGCAENRSAQFLHSSGSARTVSGQQRIGITNRPSVEFRIRFKKT